MHGKPKATAPWGLLIPLWLALVAVAAVTVVTVIGLGGASLRDRMEDIRESRFLNIAQNLKVPLETVIAIGLPLDQLPRVQEMLEREHAAEPSTLSIEVFDPHGRVVFGTDRSFLGDLVHESWLVMAESARGGSWRSDDGTVGVPLVNGFGATVGHVAVRFAMISDAEVPSFDRTATMAALIFLAVFALGLAVILGRIYAPLGRNLSAARAVLAGGQTAAAPPLAALAAQAVDRVAAERAAMDSALAEARRIDENA